MTRKWPLFLSIFSVITLILIFPGRTVFSFQADHSAVFLFSARYAGDMLSQPGGLSLYLGKFIEQFNILVWLEALILSGIITGILHMFLTLSRSRAWQNLLPLAALMSIMVLNRQLTAAHCLAIYFVLLSAKITFLFNKRLHQELFSVLMTILLIWISGGWAFAYPVVLFILRLRQDKKIGFMSPVLLILVQIFMTAFSRWVWVLPLSEYASAAMPSLDPVTLILLLLCVVNCFNIKPRKSLSITAFVLTVLVLAAGVVTYAGSDFHRSERMRQQLKNEHYDKLLNRLSKKTALSRLETCYGNYAMAQSGVLLDNMFSLPQAYGMNGLVPQPVTRGTVRSLDDYWFLATFYYDISYLDYAYRLAYDYMVLEGVTPTFTTIMIDCLLAQGHIKTADKYIRTLKHTLFYRQHAKKYDRLLTSKSLYQEKYGRKMRRNPIDEKIIDSEPEEHLYTVLARNAENRRAMDYLFASRLLAKDYSFFRETIPYLEIHYHKTLPRHVQEALMFDQLQNPENKIETGSLQIDQAEALKFIDFAKSISNDPKPVFTKYADKFAGSYMLYSYFMKSTGDK